MKGGVILVTLLSFIISFLMTSCALITNSNPKIISYSPANNAENVDIHVKLSWIAQDPDGELLIFDVYFGVTNPPPLVLIDTSSSSYDPGTLGYNKKYYWKVIAKDGKNGRADTGVLSFTTMHRLETLKWCYTTGGAIWWGMSPAIDDDENIYFGSDDGKVYSLTSDGLERWSYSTGYKIRSASTIVDDHVIVGNLNGKIMVLNKDTGTLIKQFSVPGNLWGVSVAVSENIIYFGGSQNDTKFYAYSLSDGTKLWEFTG